MVVTAPKSGKMDQSFAARSKRPTGAVATSKAFVAILPNGYPVTWGDPFLGGSLAWKAAKMHKRTPSW